MAALQRQVSHGVTAWRRARAVAYPWSVAHAAGAAFSRRALLPLPSLERGASRATASSSASQEASDGGSQQDSTPSQMLPKALLGGTAVALLAAGGAYWSLYSSDTKKPSASSAEGEGCKIVSINDEVFEDEDNLFVFFLERAEDVLNRKEDMQRIVQSIMSEPSLKRLKYYFNVSKEGDPPVPVPEAENADGKPPLPPLRVVLYKGQRKIVITVGEEIPRQKILDFYEPVSEKLSQANKKMIVKKTSNKTFAEDVIAPSSPTTWILVQLYEDTCFLCFLMRPFVNSLSKLLKDEGLPLQVMRLNVEKNDFPDGCPVARGTPTFVLFRGAQIRPVKWDEFKPKDLVERLVKEFPQLPQELQQKMDGLQNLVSRRFQLFTQLVMWTVELRKMETLLASASVPRGAGGTDGESSEDSAFNVVVSQMMSKDMKRLDGIMDNLAHLQREVDEVENDACLLGVMLAEAVIKQENGIHAA